MPITTWAWDAGPTDSSTSEEVAATTKRSRFATVEYGTADSPCDVDDSLSTLPHDELTVVRIAAVDLSVRQVVEMVEDAGSEADGSGTSWAGAVEDSGMEGIVEGGAGSDVDAAMAVSGADGSGSALARAVDVGAGRDKQPMTTKAWKHRKKKERKRMTHLEAQEKREANPIAHGT